MPIQETHDGVLGMSEGDWGYIPVQHQICVGAFSKYTQLSLLEQPCPHPDSNQVENNA